MDDRIQATLNRVLHSVFKPMYKDIKITEVYIVGTDVYDQIKKYGKEIGLGYLHKLDKLYVVNSNIGCRKIYGGYGMTDVFYYKRVKVLTDLECLTHLRDFEDFEGLSSQKGWYLTKDNAVYACDYPPECIRRSLHFAYDKFKMELASCAAGVIIVPCALTVEDDANERIIRQQRDWLEIIMVKPFDRWYILQSCRRGFYENMSEWYLVKNSAMHF